MWVASLALAGHLALSVTAPTSEEPSAAPNESGAAAAPPAASVSAERKPGGEAAPPPAASARPRTQEERAKRLAQMIDPGQYGPAFISGAQAEYVGPAVGVTSMVFGYDAVWAQVEASLGFVVGRDPLRGGPATDSYNLTLRFAVPLHRGIRADYAVVVGAGALWIDAPGEPGRVTGTFVVGTRFRVFVTPNVATVATLGAAVVFRHDAASFIFGARPLGSAGVVYFFR